MAVEAAIAGGGALLVLVFVFASWMAVVPMLMALVAIPTTFLAVWPLAEATDVSVIVKFLIALVGLAIAIDYALLVVVRWREERQRGADPHDAVVAAMEHAGKAVVFSGTTVAISLLALVVLPVPFLRSIGIAGMLIPLVSVAVAITLLPVVLATHRPAPRSPPRAPRGSRQPRLDGVGALRRSGTAGRAAILSTAVLAGLVLAASTIQLGNPQARVAGPGRPGPRRRSTSSTTPASAPARCRRSTRSSAPATPRPSSPRCTASTASAPPSRRPTGAATAPSLITVIPTEDGNSAAGRATLDRVRAATAGERRDRRRGGPERRLPRLGLRQLPARDRADRRRSRSCCWPARSAR